MARSPWRARAIGSSATRSFFREIRITRVGLGLQRLPGLLNIASFWLRSRCEFRDSLIVKKNGGPSAWRQISPSAPGSMEPGADGLRRIHPAGATSGAPLARWGPFSDSRSGLICQASVSCQLASDGIAQFVELAAASCCNASISWDASLRSSSASALPQHGKPNASSADGSMPGIWAASCWRYSRCLAVAGVGVKRWADRPLGAPAHCLAWGGSAGR